MPRIPLPRRKERPLVRGPDVRMPAFPQTATWEGRAMARLGATMASVGAKFGKLALNVQELAIRERTNTAIRESTNTLRDYETELRTKSQANPLTWGDALTKKMQEISTSQISKLKTDRERFDYKEWSSRYESTARNRLEIAAMRQVQSNYLGNLGSTMVSDVNSGQTDRFFEHLNDGLELGALTEDQVLDWKKSAVRLEALNALSAFGLDAAIEYVKTQDRVVLNPAEKASLIRRLRADAKDIEAQAEEFTEQAKRGKLREYLKRTDDRDISVDDVDADEQIFGSTLAEAMRKVAKGLHKVNSRTKTDWKKFIDLQMKLPDFWAGIEKPEGKDYIIADFLKARFVDRGIDNHTWDDFRAMMNAQVPKDYIPVLDQAFTDIGKFGKVSWRVPLGRVFGREWELGFLPERMRLSKKEAKGIAMARSATFNWLMDSLGRKKQPSTADVLTKAREFAVIYQQPDEQAEVEAAKKLSDILAGKPEALDLEDSRAINEAITAGMPFTRILEMVEQVIK